MSSAAVEGGEEEKNGKTKAQGGPEKDEEAKAKMSNFFVSLSCSLYF